MKETISQRKQKLSNQMSSYYHNNGSYHINIPELTGERPSTEEKALFEKIKTYHNFPQNTKLLELGCGSCECAPALVSMLDVQEYYGVDASPFAIQSACQKHPSYNLNVGDATHLPFADNFFDVVISNFVLEHMVEPERFLKEAVRVTRKGGLIGLILPVYDLPWLIPPSLRYQRQNINFLVRYSVIRWIEMLKLRYQAKYFKFRIVEKPIVLLETKNYNFQPDDDLVYIASSLEISKYLMHSGCEVLSLNGRDITPCITNGNRPIIDILRWITFNLLRLSLMKKEISDYTTTVSIVVRKNID